VETVGPPVAARPSPQASVKKETSHEQFEVILDIFCIESGYKLILAIFFIRNWNKLILEIFCIKSWYRIS